MASSPIDENVGVDLFFEDESRVNDFLVNTAGALSPQEGQALMDSKISFANIFRDYPFYHFFDILSCEDLLQARDVYANEEFYDRFCIETWWAYNNKTLDALSFAINAFNLDYISEEMKALAQRASQYWAYDIIGDFGDFIGIMYDTPHFWYYINDVRPVLHFELWFHELQDLVVSICEAYPKYDWTV